MRLAGEIACWDSGRMQSSLHDGLALGPGYRLGLQ
jgi:hypothetical protein